MVCLSLGTREEERRAGHVSGVAGVEEYVGSVRRFRGRGFFARCWKESGKPGHGVGKAATLLVFLVDESEGPQPPM